jgi:endonuclease III
MEMPVSDDAIRDALIRIGDEMNPFYLFPTLEKAADKLTVEDPYAFCIACCLDRGMKSGVVWTIPWYIQQDLGHLDPFRIARMSLSDLGALFRRLPRKPRFINVAPRTLQELTAIVVQQPDGDASRLWKGKSAAGVKAIFESIYGVGPALASMTILLIQKAFGEQFADLDRRVMGIKPDVHTMRVLYRLGVAEAQSESAAVQAARRLNPEFPGAIDAGLWYVGKEWCDALHPDCEACQLQDLCARLL